MLAPQLVRGLRLALEALARLGELGVARQEQLERDALVQVLVPCGEDHPHAADPDDPLDAVLAEKERPLGGDWEAGEGVVLRGSSAASDRFVVGVGPYGSDVKGGRPFWRLAIARQGSRFAGVSHAEHGCLSRGTRRSLRPEKARDCWNFPAGTGPAPRLVMSTRNPASLVVFALVASLAGGCSSATPRVAFAVKESAVAKVMTPDSVPTTESLRQPRPLPLRTRPRRRRGASTTSSGLLFLTAKQAVPPSAGRRHGKPAVAR